MPLIEAYPLDMLGLFIVLGFGIRTGWVFSDFLSALIDRSLDQMHGWLLRRQARRKLAELAEAAETPDLERDIA